MKRLLFVILAVALCVAMVACGSSEPTSTTNPQSTTASTITTTTPTSTVATTVTAPTSASATTDLVSDPTGGPERLTVSQPFADKEDGALLAKLPWTAAPKASFYAEVPYGRGQAYEVFFTTDSYEFMRGYMADTTFVFADGDRYKQKDLQGLVDNGTIAPDELISVFDLEPKTKTAVDATTQKELYGKMIPYRRGREATVKQGESMVHIYPPFDFIGEFYEDDRYSVSIGYYVNATYLEQLIDATYPTAEEIDTTQGIRVGKALFVPLSAAKKAGITIDVSEKSEDIYRTPSLKIVLSNSAV